MAIDGDIELDKYLGFIFKKYHGSYDGTHKSQAVDLAGFLLYMEFDPEREPAGSWKRVIKPWSQCDSGHQYIGFAILTVLEGAEFIGRVCVLRHGNLALVAISVRHYVSLWVFAV